MDNPKRKIAIVFGLMGVELSMARLKEMTHDLDIEFREATLDEAEESYRKAEHIEAMQLQNIVIDMTYQPKFFNDSPISHNPRQERRELNKYKK